MRRRLQLVSPDHNNSVKPDKLLSNSIIMEEAGEGAWTAGGSNYSLINTSNMSGALACCHHCKDCLPSRVIHLSMSLEACPGMSSIHVLP